MSTTSRLLKSHVADAVFIGMILVAVVGLTYQLLR